MVRRPGISFSYLAASKMGPTTDHGHSPLSFGEYQRRRNNAKIPPHPALWGAAGLLFTLLFIALTVWPSPALASGCAACHQGIEVISPSHDFSCVTCHGGDETASEKDKAHAGIVANPSSLDQAEERCGSCHPDQVKGVQSSLMATAAGMVNQTRYLLGAQDTPDPVYSGSFTSPLPVLPDVQPSGPPADDLLRRKCLRCHLQNRGAARFGDYRADGCASCHVPYANAGMSRSADRAVRGFMAEVASGAKTLTRGYPELHRMRTDVPVSQCTHCHNSNYVGSDYVGKFERDYHSSARFLSTDGESLRADHGMDHHRLLPDLHFQRGLGCIDCHVQQELMGDGKVYGFSFRQLRVGCEDCHGAVNGEPRKTVLSDAASLRMAAANPRYDAAAGDEVLITARGAVLAHVKKVGESWVLTSKVTGERHVIPQLKDTRTVNHLIPQHMKNMECSSCHAAWSFQQYGLHLLLDESTRYEPWRSLWAQNDPQVQTLLSDQLSRDVAARTPPVTRDWLTGEDHPGVWYAGWSYRRWAGNVLGRNASGKVSVLRPLFQFVLSRVDARGRTLLDSAIPKTRGNADGWAMNPYAPHSIRKQTVACEGCHLNPKAIGLGLVRFMPRGGGYEEIPVARPWSDGLDVDFGLEQTTRITGQQVQHSTHPGARGFNRQEIEALLSKSPAYLRYWLMERRKAEGKPGS